MLFSDIKPSFLFEIKLTPELYLLCVLSTETLSIYLSLILKGYSKKFWKTAQLPEEWVRYFERVVYLAREELDAYKTGQLLSAIRIRL